MENHKSHNHRYFSSSESTEADRKQVKKFSKGHEHSDSDIDPNPGSSKGNSSKCKCRKSYFVMNDRYKLFKCLKDWIERKFSGEEEDEEETEEFLLSLQDFRYFTEINDEDLLFLLPFILTERALTWYRLNRNKIKSWKEFNRAFRRRFNIEYNDLDLHYKLNACLQAKDENISDYLQNFRTILNRFKKPPLPTRQVKIAYRNLTPEYRKYMLCDEIESLDALEDLGRKWERCKYLDSLWTPPPRTSSIPGAAYTGR